MTQPLPGGILDFALYEADARYDDLKYTDELRVGDIVLTGEMALRHVCDNPDPAHRRLSAIVNQWCTITDRGLRDLGDGIIEFVGFYASDNALRPRTGHRHHLWIVKKDSNRPADRPQTSTPRTVEVRSILPPSLGGLAAMFGGGTWHEVGSVNAADLEAPAAADEHQADDDTTPTPEPAQPPAQTRLARFHAVRPGRPDRHLAPGTRIGEGTGQAPSSTRRTSGPAPAEPQSCSTSGP